MSDFPYLPFFPTFKSDVTRVTIGVAVALIVVSMIVLAFVGDGYGSAQAAEPPIKIGLSMSLTGPLAATYRGSAQNVRVTSPFVP